VGEIAKKQSEGVRFLLFGTHVFVRNTLLQTSFSAILPTGDIVITQGNTVKTIIKNYTFLLGIYFLDDRGYLSRLHHIKYLLKKNICQ